MLEKFESASFAKVMASCTLMALLAGAFTVPQVHANPNQNPYPPGTSTNWAWQNRPDLPATLGEAKDWDGNAAAQGWPVSRYPRPGSVAVHEPGVLGAHSQKGRVAVVRQVLDNGSYVVTQVDDAGCPGSSQCGQVSTRTYALTAGASFIHYQKDSRTTWGFGGGAAGWTHTNLGQGHMDAPGWRYPLMTTGEPYLTSPQLDVPLDGYAAVEVRMVVDRTVADSRMQLAFSTAAYPGFVPERKAWLRGIPDGRPHTYIFYVASNTQWRGLLTGLRLYPAGAGRIGNVRVDRIRLLSPDSSLFSGFIGIKSIGTNLTP